MASSSPMVVSNVSAVGPFPVGASGPTTAPTTPSVGISSVPSADGSTVVIDNQLEDNPQKEALDVNAPDQEDTYDSCCICFEGKEFVLTSCCHLFCLPCITRWIEISGTCPICRNEFEKGVKLYNLIGTVEDTVRTLKELQKKKRDLWKRREMALARHRELVTTAPSAWNIFHQVLNLLFSEPSETDPMLGLDPLDMDDDSMQQLAQFNLTQVDLPGLTGQRAQNVALAQGHQRNHATSPFPFLSFCCLPQPSAASMSLCEGRMH